MEINRLRSIIRESISNNLKEIEDIAENAAMEAKLQAYTEAIEKVNNKIETAESLEEMQELVDPAKLNELKKHLKLLEKSKEKLEKVKAKKNKGKEVVTDEPVEEGNPDFYNDEMKLNIDNKDKDNDDFYEKEMKLNVDEADLSDEEKEELRKKAEQNPSLALPEGTLNEAFLKMQKLAGVITEAQYNQKKSLIENELAPKKAADTTEKAAEDLADNPDQVKQALTKAKQAGVDLNLVKQAADQLKQGKSYEDVLKSITNKVQENLNEISAADYRSKEKKQGIGFGGLAGAFISMFPAFGAYTAGAAGTAAATSSPDLLIAMGIVALAGAAIGYAFRDKGSGAGSTSGEVVTDTGILNTAAWEFKNQMTKQGRSNTLPNVDLFYIVDHGETPEELKGKEVWRFKVEDRDVVGDKDALFQSREGKSVSDGSDRDKRRKKGDYS